MDKFLSYIKSNKFIFIVVAAIILLLVFKAGMSFGYHRAIFNSEWGQNYYKNFYGNEQRLMPMIGFSDRGSMGMHGTVGTIIDISSSSISIKGSDNVEKSVVIDGDEVVRKGGNTISFSDLKTGDNVAVIGRPNANGQIEARFIRIFSATGNSKTK